MRPTCSSCSRPLRVCLCAQLPPQPIHTTTKVIILQHPHETRQKLATVPLVAHCLSNVHVIVGRRLQFGTSQLLDALSRPSSASSPSPSITNEDGVPSPVDDSGWRCRSCARRKTVLLLFPTPTATDLRIWMDNRVANAVPSDRTRGLKANRGTSSNECDGDGEEKLYGGQHSVEFESSFHGLCGSDGEEGNVGGQYDGQLQPSFHVVGSSNVGNAHFGKFDNGHESGENGIHGNVGKAHFGKLDNGHESGEEGIHAPELGTKFHGVCNSDSASGHIILLIIDGTWQHAGEMVKASMPFLNGFVEQVSLPHDIAREGWGLGEGDSKSIMKKEPFAGCVSTMEAIARAIGILEPNGVHIQETLLSVLKEMVHLQAIHFVPMKPRRRPRKEHRIKGQSSHSA